jgi:hypothetical protein
MMNLTPSDVVDVKSLRVGDIVFWDRRPRHMNVSYSTRDVNNPRPHLVISYEEIDIGGPYQLKVIFVDISKNEEYIWYGNDFAQLSRCAII